MGVSARLYLRWLWLARSYPFLWAHKPLCARFREDVLRFGHVHLCRSCLCLYLGLATGLVLPVAESKPAGDPAGWVLGVLLAVTLVLSGPGVYKKLPRRVRDLLRFALGLSISLWFWRLLAGDVLLSLVLFLITLFSWWRYRGPRVTRKKEACLACAEFTGRGICSGFARQAELIRRYEEEATDYVLATGYVPNCLSRRER